jgi:aspartate racemase
MVSTRKIIGIVGGMGPLAGQKLLNEIITNTKANTDQEHDSVVLISYPKFIDDRTSFLYGETETNPARSIIEIIRKLEACGAEVIGMPCNTAHAPSIFGLIQQYILKKRNKVKLLHMPTETCMYLKKCNPLANKIGIMATNGTLLSGLYQDILSGMGYEVIVPDHKFQNGVIHRMIYDNDFGIKSSSGRITSEVKVLIKQSIDYFRERNADAIILGCTELSLVKHDYDDEKIALIDSLEVLAHALIREAGQ